MGPPPHGTVVEGLPFCFPQTRHEQPHCQKPDSTHGVSIGPALLAYVPQAIGMVLGGLMSERKRRERHALQAGEENMISQSLGIC